MSFVDRFYSFLIELAAIERHVFERVRLKVPKYPNESLNELVARVLVYAHNWSPQLEFSDNPLNTETPTLFERNHQGSQSLQITVGVPDPKCLRLAVRRDPESTFAIYFSHREQIERFSHLLRGTKENWVAPIQFYLIPAECIESLASVLQSSNQWSITDSEQTFYIEVGDQQLEIPLVSIDIWQEYQRSLSDKES